MSLNFFLLHKKRSEQRLHSRQVFESYNDLRNLAYLVIAGNIAIGNLPRFLPSIIQLVESDSRKRLLALHASKEVHIAYARQVHPLIKLFRSSRIALKGSWRAWQICSGYLSSKTQKTRRRPREMSLLPASANLQLHILPDICLNYMYALLALTLILIFI